MRFLFVDRILHSIKGERIQGIKHITADDYYLSLTDTGRHHFMPSLIGETLGQLAAWNIMDALDFTKRPVAGVVASVTVHRPAYVGDTLLLESYIDALDDMAVQYHSVARVGDDTVFTIEGALGPLLPMDDFIGQAEVRRQFTEINRPGEWPVASMPFFEPLLPDGRHLSAQCPSFDAICMSEPGIQLSAVKRISRSAPYFADHFPNKPVLPMTMLLECKLNLARELIKRAAFQQSYQMSAMRRIKMNEFVYPGDVVTCHVSVKKQDEHELVLSFRSEVEGKRVCVMELCCNTILG